MFLELSLILGVEVFTTLDIRKELIKDLSFVNLHLDEVLSVSRVQLVFLDCLYDFVDASSSFLHLIIKFFTLNNLVKTSHHCGLNHTDATIHIVVLDSRN